jgi:hypothetical protein
MKNITEACESTFVYKVRDQGEESTREVKTKIATDLDRWKGIDDEVRNCPHIQMYVAQMIAFHAAGKVPLGECLMATAAQMVAVGMEMERSDERMPV